MWTKEQQDRWRAEHSNQCVDCGQRCGVKAQRCQTCENKRRRKVALERNLEQGFCLECGKPINRRSNGAIKGKKGAAKRCQSCETKRRWASGQFKRNRMKGKECPAWKSGRFKNSGGYIMIYNPSHPKANKRRYVLEHILVWEEANGKSLPQGWMIHHLNGIKDDNRIANLAAMPNRKHYLVLQAKAKRIQELEALLNNQHQLL